MSTISELRDSLDGPSQEYRTKQLHPVPEVGVVDRSRFIIERCKDKYVLDIGATGPMHEAICEVAKWCYGVSKPSASGVQSDVVSPNRYTEYIDLDLNPSAIPVVNHVEVVVCGEVIEHLSNPGHFLSRLRQTYKCPIIITVPNAFGDGGRKLLDVQGLENCNVDHVAWYSHRTIKTLLERHGFAIKEFYWYGHKGQRPKFSEGLIVVTE